MPTNLSSILTADTEIQDVEGFSRTVFRQKLTLRLKNCATLAADPSLPGRLRGAFGWELAETASDAALKGTPCPWTPPCAFDVLFRNQGRINAHTEIPKPWLITVDPQEADLDVTLILFGLASEWMPAAAELFTRAVRNRINWPRLSEGAGVSATSGASAGSDRFRTAVAPPRLGHIEGRQLQTLEGVEHEIATLPDIAVLLDFLSPATVSGHNLTETPAALFHEVGNRLEGMARWHGVSLRGTVDWRFLKGLDKSFDIFWQDPLPLAWTRRSGRQERTIRMAGVAGQLVIRADTPQHEMPVSETAAHGSETEVESNVLTHPLPTLADLWPVLVLGEVVHIGADTAFGCGRYTLLAA